MNLREAKALIAGVNRWGVVTTQRMGHIIAHHVQGSRDYQNGSYFTDDSGSALDASQTIQRYGGKIANLMTSRNAKFMQDPRGDANSFLVVEQVPPRTGTDPRARNLQRRDHPAPGAEGPVTYGGDTCHWLVCVVKKNARRGPNEEPIIVTTAYPATQLYVQGLTALT